MKLKEQIKHRVAIAGLVSNAEAGQVIHLEGSGESAFSDRKGNYLLSGLEVSKVQTSVRVSAQGYPLASQRIQLKQGEMQTLKFELKK